MTTTVSILGAHTEHARAVVAAIEERELDVRLRLYTSAEFIDEGLELFGPGAVDADVVIVAIGGELGRGLADGALRLGRRVIDLADASAGHPQARWVWPILDEGRGPESERGVIARVAIGLAEPIAAVLRALTLAGPERVVVSTYESAAVADRPGMDELLDQVRSVYTMRDIRTEVLGTQLAFSVLPDPELAREEVLEAQLADALAELSPRPVLHVSRALVSSFSAECAAVHVDLVEPIERARVLELIDAARGVRVLDDRTPQAIDANERDDALVGGVRVRDRHVSLWLACDRLRRGVATGVASIVERWAEAG
jgi:aspartate-semialdehyde dehydrogenase